MYEDYKNQSDLSQYEILQLLELQKTLLNIERFDSAAAIGEAYKIIKDWQDNLFSN